MSEHYGFLISPCRLATPEHMEHEGKIERDGVRYVSQNSLAGCGLRNMIDANNRMLGWCMEIAIDPRTC